MCHTLQKQYCDKNKCAKTVRRVFIGSHHGHIMVTSGHIMRYRSVCHVLFRVADSFAGYILSPQTQSLFISYILSDNGKYLNI
jgi:hypothetical protein